MLWQPSLPERYTRASSEDLARDIADRRRELGEALVILGHHYQTDEIIRHADVTGDSLKLSQIAAKVAGERATRYVIFCGVHFMAETADMLTPDSVDVILPDLSAGCSMADMAAYDDTVEAWETIHAELRGRGWNGTIVPITYVNSTAAIKAFVGAHGGACCTSSNASEVFRWAREQGGPNGKILFLPDQHLGRNTAAKAGIDAATRTCLYDPKKTRQGQALGGATGEQLLASDVILWAGHCSVHKLFRPEHCDQMRAMSAAEPDKQPWTILVHPECAKEVVDKSDLNGSTEYIIKSVREAKPGTRLAVGTEVHLVNRLAAEARGRGVEVRILSDCQCLCTTMYRIDQPHLLWVLDHLTGRLSKDGTPKVVNKVSVHPDVRRDALLAVDRMLALSSPGTARMTALATAD
jgi:quinolinate synthase